MWLAVGKMFTTRRQVNDIMMVSESCEKTWDPVWGSILFCYHERLLKGWKSSLSPPRPPWQKFLSFPSLLAIIVLCSFKKPTGLLDSLQGTSTGPAQGEQDPVDGAYGRQEHPTEDTAITRLYRMTATWNRDWSSQSALRDEGKTFPKDQRWQKRIGQTQPQWLKVWMWRPTCKNRGGWGWRNEWFQMLFISIMPDRCFEFFLFTKFLVHIIMKHSIFPPECQSFLIFFVEFMVKVDSP